jgi:signal transduction histidine kinase
MKPQTQQSCPRPFPISFFASVRLRLTVWYLLTIFLLLVLLEVSLYGLQMHLRENALDSEIETQLYRAAQPVMTIYKHALLTGQSPTSQHIDIAPGEVLLLLRPDRTILDQHGPLTSSALHQLQDRVQNSQEAFTLALPVPQTDNLTQHWQGWQGSIEDYRLVTVPLSQKNTLIALLMLGLPRPDQGPLFVFWLLNGLLLVLVSLLGGYWLAGRALRPITMILHLANDIQATDLRRRLQVKRRDEFGALAATFNQMLVRLEAAFQRQTRFTADASHELRTPLTIIELEVHRALTQLHTPQEYRQALEVIGAESAQMVSVVTSLLTLARADSGQMALERQTLDLSDLALATVERLLPLARQSQVRLATGELPELLVSGDPQYLSRMVMNLIENAIKYTRGVGTRVHVDLACEQEQWGVIRVQDDGPGIAEDHLPSLFERFYRADKARSANQNRSAEAHAPGAVPGGTGLGLSITQWIVQAHGGSIRVESQMGMGSLFEVRLPLLKQEEEPE